jgi:hypothetical protein
MPDNQDKTCQINVHNVHGWKLDPDATNKAMLLCARHLDTAKMIDIYPQEMVPLDAPAWKNPGWLEWIVRVHYRTGGTITIGLIRRQPGADFECHS